MKLRIAHSSFAVARALTVERDGVCFQQTVFMGGKRRFAFSQVDCVLMSPNNELSFQVGDEVFTVPTKPGKRGHEAAIAALLEGVRRSVGRLA